MYDESSLENCLQLIMQLDLVIPKAKLYFINLLLPQLSFSKITIQFFSWKII